jgi:hypothetical protein
VTLVSAGRQRHEAIRHILLGIYLQFGSHSLDDVAAMLSRVGTQFKIDIHRVPKRADEQQGTTAVDIDLCRRVKTSANRRQEPEDLVRV